MGWSSQVGPAASTGARDGGRAQERGSCWRLLRSAMELRGRRAGSARAPQGPHWIPADLPPSDCSCSPDGSLQRPGQAGTPVQVAGSLRRPPTAAGRPQQFQLYQHASPQPHSIPPGAGMAEAATRPNFSHDASPALVVRGGESRTPSVCSSVILDAKDPPAKSEAAPKPPASAPPSILVKPDTSRNNAEKVRPAVPGLQRVPILLGLALNLISPGAKACESFPPFSPGFLLIEVTGIGSCIKKSDICVADSAVQIKPFRKARCCRDSLSVNQCSVTNKY